MYKRVIPLFSAAIDHWYKFLSQCWPKIGSTSDNIVVFTSMTRTSWMKAYKKWCHFYSFRELKCFLNLFNSFIIFSMKKKSSVTDTYLRCKQIYQYMDMSQGNSIFAMATRYLYSYQGNRVTLWLLWQQMKLSRYLYGTILVSLKYDR